MRLLAFGMDMKQLGEILPKSLTEEEIGDLLRDDPAPTVLVTHGITDELIRDWAQEYEQLWILLASTAPMARKAMDWRNPRISGLAFGLSDDGSGDEPAAWMVDRIRRFAAKVREPDTTEPPWEMLKSPGVPEYLLGCYLCVYGGHADRIPESWRSKFEDEVRRFTLERPEASPPELTWGDKSCIEKLRAFLEWESTLVSYIAERHE